MGGYQPQVRCPPIRQSLGGKHGPDFDYERQEEGSSEIRTSTGRVAIGACAIAVDSPFAADDYGLFADRRRLKTDSFKAHTVKIASPTGCLLSARSFRLWTTAGSTLGTPAYR